MQARPGYMGERYTHTGPVHNPVRRFVDLGLSGLSESIKTWNTMSALAQNSLLRVALLLDKTPKPFSLF